MLVPGRKMQVFSIKELIEKNAKKTVWVKAGTAWVNRDGSLNVYLDVLPLEGKLHVREVQDERREAPEKASSTNGSSTQAAELAESMGGH